MEGGENFLKSNNYNNVISKYLSYLKSLDGVSIEI